MIDRSESNVHRQMSAMHGVLGILFIFAAVIVVLFGYGYLSGLASGGQGDLVLPRESIDRFFLSLSAILFLGVLGGFELGRYVQAILTRKKEEFRHPPPP